MKLPTPGRAVSDPSAFLTTWSTAIAGWKALSRWPCTIRAPAPKLLTAERKAMRKRAVPELASVSTCTSRGYFCTRSGSSALDAACAGTGVRQARASASRAKRVLTAGHDSGAPDGVCQNRPSMSTADTKAQIAQAIDRFGDEVPSLKQLKLVIRLELLARGDIPTWRVEVPGPNISKDPAADARLAVSIPHSDFNQLVKAGRLRDWVDAYEHGHVNVSGEPAVVKLVGNVIERQLARSGGRAQRGPPHLAHQHSGALPRAGG